MHIIPEWDGTWVRQKVACFKVWGQKTYTRLFERDFRSFSAMLSSNPRMAGASHYTYLTARRDDDHPIRASECGRAKGRPDDTWSKFQDRQPSLDQQHSRISIGRYRLPPQFQAFLFLPGAISPFCDAIQNIVVDVDPRPSAVAGQGQNTLTWSGPIPLSETAFNGCFWFILLVCFCLAD